jgi:Icc protein
VATRTVWRAGDLTVLGVNTAGTGAGSGGPTALADTHDGFVDANQMAALDAALADTDDPTVVALHHNLPDTTTQFLAARDPIRPESEQAPPVLREADPLLDVLARHDVPLALTGHLHLPAVGGSRGVCEVLASTTSEFPSAYVLVDVAADGTTVRFVPVRDGEGQERAYAERVAGSENARVGAGLAAARLGAMPLVDER